MSDMIDEQMIEALRKEALENRAEIKGLKALEDLRVSVIREAEKHRSLLKDHVEINELLMLENKALKAIMDELLEAVEQSEIVFRMNKDFDRARMLVPIIQRAKALKGESI